MILATAGQRIDRYMDAFKNEGLRITENLDFNPAAELWPL